MPLKIETASDLLDNLMMCKDTGETIDINRLLKEHNIDRIAFSDELQVRLEYWRQSLKRVLDSEEIVFNFEVNKGVHDITIGMLEGFERQLYIE